jgi:16S rRNA (uracil1498-N3)-methyltransferase
MQCRRARVPEVDPLVQLHEIASKAGLVLADRTGTGADELAPPGPEGWTVVSGPEGGFEPAELELLAALPRLAVGPHVLRAETAPIAAVGALAARASTLL